MIDFFNIKEIRKKIHSKYHSLMGTEHHHHQHHEKKEEKNDKQIPKEEDTEKVLELTVIDINKTLEQNIIQCITKPIEELAYIAISYRWGEVQEQIVPTAHY